VNERTPGSPAEFARPESDPGLRGAPQGARGLLPSQQVSVRVRRGSDGQLSIVEFLSPGLTESEKVALRLAFQQGELQLEGEGASGEESWIATLLRSRSR
jgi:hypothetical protein